jgi:hypothetical protein
VSYTASNFNTLSNFNRKCDVLVFGSFATLSGTDQALVAHICNPSYSGGRAQEDQGSKPARKIHKTLFQKNPSQKRTGRMVKV